MATTLNAGTSTSGAAISADTTGILQLQSGSTPTTAVTIDTSQNVGIGTASPSQKLEVAGNVLLSNNQYFGVKDTTGAAVGFPIYTGSNDAIFGYLASGSTGVSTYQFRTGNNTERMRLDSSGNLLVGTTNSTLYNQGAGVTGLKLSGTNCQMASTGTMFDFNNTSGGGINAVNWWYRGGNVGNILVNTTSTAYNTTSDYRLKEDVQPMVGALDKVAALKPCTYTWKVDGSDGQGFIAHELAEVVPQCVSGEKDAVNEDGSIKPQGIDTSFLVATLTAAIQEQQALIQDLTTRLAALEAK